MFNQRYKNRYSTEYRLKLSAMLFKKFYLSIYLLFVLLCGCSEPFQQSVVDVYDKSNSQLAASIIGGALVTEKDPMTMSVVLIYVLNEEGVPETCTGSFISDTHILTAAHCVSDVENMSITQGVNPLNSSDMKLFKIAKITKHPYYKKEKEFDRNDLAIIQVEQSENFKIKALSLPTIDMIANLDKVSHLYLNENLISFGYGLSDESADSPDYILRSMALSYLSSAGKTEWRAQQSLLNGLCSGDSGGPVILKHKKSSILVGVASGVYQDCHSTALFMNIYPYLSWIYNNIK